MKKIIFLMILVFTITSCASISIGKDGIKINNDGNSVSIGGDGIDVNMDGNSVNIGGDGIDVNMDGNSVNIGEDGINVNTKVSIANLKTGGEISDLSDEDKSQFGELSEEVLNNDCKTQFNQLISVFGNDYSSCKLTQPRKTNCGEQQLESSKVNIAIIFDASGSMNATIGDEYMINVAKEEVKKYISSLDSNTQGLVIVYGHKGDSTYAKKDLSCKGIENIGDFTNKNELISKISSINAKGWTPIDESLKLAKKYLDSISKGNDQKIILLVSDGKETCDGNPASTAKQIAADKNTYIDVIGFNVYGDTQTQLSEIAKYGNGKYSNVRSRADFERVFLDMQAFTNEVKCGASQAAIQLRAAVDSINTYYMCDYMLAEEKVKVYTNMSGKCSYEIETLMENRADVITNKLDVLLEKAEEQLASYIDYLDDMLDKF